MGADSYTETYSYDTWDGNLSAMQSASGQTLTYGYDGLRRLTTVDTSLYEKTYSYRNLEDGRATGQVSSVTYDLPTDQSFAYTYDNMGNIVTYTDTNGTVTYTYDDLGQLTKAEGAETYEYSYDNAGNILSANGHTYTYGDSTWADLLTKVDGETITYDAIGNPTSYYNGTSWSFTWARGRSLATASDGTDTISYTYDADGLRTGKTVISPLDNSQKNGLFVDSDGETRYYVDGVATYAGLVYWDGYFYYINSSMKAVRSRTYWPTVTNDLIPVAEYTFDENGRITNPPVVGIDAQGQPKNGIYADADGEIRYYVNGIATYAKLVYCNGHYYYIGSSLKAVRDTTYWVTYTNGMMESGSYTFDAQGRMVNPPEDALTEAISTFALTGETMSKTYDYVYASGKLMRQVLTVTIGNSTTTYAMDFFYDASGYPFAVKYNGDLCYYITNLQGDVMSIVDAQGEVVAEYEYDPYGNIVSQSGPLADVNPLRYRGYVFDSETQFYYLQSRYYDPEIGQFINADSLVSTGQGMLGYNMFTYCLNNPINFVDSGGDNAEAVQWWTSIMWWLCGADTVLPVGDIIYGAGILILGVYALTVADEVTMPQISLEEEKSSVYEYREHTKGARQSTKSKHQKGQTRKNRDNRGEKGDARRYYIGNKKKLRMFFLIVGDLIYEDESTQDVTSGGASSAGFGGSGGTHSIFAVHMLY